MGAAVGVVNEELSRPVGADDPVKSLLLEAKSPTHCTNMIRWFTRFLEDQKNPAAAKAKAKAKGKDKGKGKDKSSEKQTRKTFLSTQMFGN